MGLARGPKSSAAERNRKSDTVYTGLRRDRDLRPPALIVFSGSKNNTRERKKNGKEEGPQRATETPITRVKDIDGVVSGLVDAVDLSTTRTQRRQTKRRNSVSLDGESAHV